MEKINLSTAEWNIMESLWLKAPKIGSEIVNDLKESIGWSRSTTLTMLRRMTEKGLLLCSEKNGIKTYTPMMEREDAAKQETTDFLNKVYNGSISLMMSTFVKKQDLSKQEIDELHEILKKAAEEKNA